MTGNWFERYSITGTYFVIITMAWFYSVTPYNEVWQFGHLIEAIGIVVITALPLGFIISNFSGWLYYHTGQFKHNIIYHPQILKQVAQNISLEDLKNLSEFETETEFIIRFRLNNTENQGILEKIKWYSEPVVKRWDIFAISINLMLATILSFVLCFVPAVIIALFTNTFSPDCSIIIGIVFVIEAAIFIILYWIRREMFKQIVNRIQRLDEFLPAREA